jgi:hypothetical protein
LQPHGNTDSKKKQSPVTIIFHAGGFVTLHRAGHNPRFYRNASIASIDRLERLAHAYNARWGRYWSDTCWMSGQQARLWHDEVELERDDDMRSYLMQ